MTALSDSPAVDCTPVVDDFVRRFPAHDLATLRLLLQVLQRRLGTPAEQPCDVERAQALGHEINNRATAANLQRDLRRLGDSASFSS